MVTRRRHHKLVLAILFLATVVGLVSVLSIWVKRQVLETDTWTTTSTKLLENQQVEEALSGYLVEVLYENVDVRAELAAALPPAAQPLAGPAAAGLRQLAGKLAFEALGRPQVQELWSQANRSAHALFLELVEGGGDQLSTEGGSVSLDLGSIVERLGDQLGVDVADKLPADAGRIELIRSDELSAAQEAVNALKGLSLILPLVALALYALAVYLARGWRREAVRAWGISWIMIGVLILVVRSLAGDVLVDRLAGSDSVEPAVEAVWEIGTSLLRDGGIAILLYGFAILLGAILAGPLGAASEIRRTLTPLLRTRLTAYAIAAFVVLLLVWWAPTEGFRRPLPLLILLALFVAGIEAFRRQALREYPHESWDSLRERWARRATGQREGSDRDFPRAPAGGGASTRLADLERLVAMRNAGVLDDTEFESEKKRLLASPGGP